MISGRPRAFTLIEVTLVVAIIAVLAGIAIPRFSGAIKRHRANQAAYRIKADLDRARAHAKAASTTVRVTFDEANHKYTIDKVRDINLAAGTYEVDLTEEPYRCKFVSVLITSANPYIEYDGYGNVDSNCTVFVHCGDYQRVVAVDVNGGTAKIP